MLRENHIMKNQNFSLQWISRNSSRNRVTRQTLEHPSTDEPRIVFFPSNQDLSSSNICQDEISTKEQSGFNTFGFLSFALTIFNVMR